MRSKKPILFSILFLFIITLFSLLGNSDKPSEKELIFSHIKDCAENTNITDEHGLTFQGSCLVGIRGFVESFNKESIKLYPSSDSTSGGNTMKVFYGDSPTLYKMNCGVGRPCSVGAEKQEVEMGSNYLNQGDCIQLSLINSKNDRITFGRMVILGKE